MSSYCQTAREPICNFHTRAWFQLRISRILFAAKYLYLGSYLQVTWWLSANEMEGKNTSNDNAGISESYREFDTFLKEF